MSTGKSRHGMKGKTTLRITTTLVVLSFFLFTVRTAKAQASFHLGGTVGPQYTTITSDYGTYNGIIGLQGGLSSELRFGANFSTQLDLVASLAGAERSYYDSLIAPGYYKTYTIYNTTDRLMYTQAHLLFKFNIPLTGERIIPYDLPNNNPTSISIYAGPYFGYLLSANRTGNVQTLTYDANNDKVMDVTSSSALTSAELDGIYKMDVGLTGGLGINFGLTDKTTLSVDVRASKGFSPIDLGYYGHYTAVLDANGEPKGLEYIYAKNYNMQMVGLVSFRVKLF